MIDCNKYHIKINRQIIFKILKYILIKISKHKIFITSKNTINKIYNKNLT